MNKEAVLEKIKNDGQVEIPLGDVEQEFFVEDIFDELGIKHKKMLPPSRKAKTIIIKAV